LAQHGPSASCAILLEGSGRDIRYGAVEAALAEPDTGLRLFGKPEVKGRRRMGVALARAASIDEARAKARRAAEAIVAGATMR
jgi:phosphoribosylglycinamide formyltransferase 2